MTALPRVLIVDGDNESADWLRGSLGRRYRVAVTNYAPDVARALAADGVDVLIFGLAANQVAGPDELADLRARAQQADVPVLVVEHDPAAAAVADDDESIFYVIRRGLSANDYEVLVRSALGKRFRAGETHESIQSTAEAARMQRVLEMSRRFALQSDLAGATNAAIEATIELMSAERAHCLFHDASAGALWSEAGDSEQPCEGTAAQGLAGFAARTKSPVCVDDVGKDPRYHGPLDDPGGDGNERLIAQPISTSDGQVHAVLVGVRGANRAPFSEDERALLATFAKQAGPLLGHLALRIEAESVLNGEGEQQLFRREAVEAYDAYRKQGDVIRVSPAWVRWSYWLLVALMIAGGVYMAVGTIDQYSAGPAVVRVTGRTEITARVAGTIVELLVSPGDRVREGQLLARFYDAEEAAAYRRTQREFEAQLRNRMLDPSNEATTQAVQALREQKDAAEARLRERELRAPSDGTISDIRVRPGQHIVPGDAVLSLVSGDEELAVIAFLPGGDRPQLAPGMPLRLELHNYQYAYQQVTIESVDSEVIGPTQAQRYLGAALADALPISGPVVVVRARLPTTTFEADGVRYEYHDGMAATAEVKVRSETILETLIPGVKRL